MVAQAQEGLGGLLQSNETQWRAYLTGLMKQMGIDPSRNIYAAQTLKRAPEAQWLGQAMNVKDTGIQDYAQQWVNARLGGGGSYGGVDLSRGGMSNWLSGAMQSNDPNSQQYKTFNTGDPEADYANLGSAMGIIQGGYSPMAQRAEQKTLGDWYMQAINQMQGAGPTVPTNLLDYYYGRTNAGPGVPAGATPGQPAAPGAQTAAYNTNPQTTQTGQTPTPGAVNPNMTQTPVAPGQWAPTTPGATPNPVVRGPQYGTTPTPGQPGAAPGGISNWTQLLDKYRADQRNWGTEGFRPTPEAFSIGGISYDPRQDQVTGFKNMSGSGRVTNRGSFMGQFLYYFNLLRNQRDQGGNAQLGINRQTTDDQLARIAQQRMGANAIGSTGMTAR